MNTTGFRLDERMAVPVVTDSDIIDELIKLQTKTRNFARESLEVAINRGVLMGDDDISEDLIEQWEKLTGEVYGKDYCQR